MLKEHLIGLLHQNRDLSRENFMTGGMRTTHFRETIGMAGDDGHILRTRFFHDGRDVLLDRQLQTLILSRSGRVRIFSDVLARNCVLDYTK